MEGRAETAKKSLQLWNWNEPREELMLVWGIMIQAKAPHRSRPTIQKVDWTPR